MNEITDGTSTWRIKKVSDVTAVADYNTAITKIEFTADSWTDNTITLETTKNDVLGVFKAQEVGYKKVLVAVTANTGTLEIACNESFAGYALLI